MGAMKDRMLRGELYRPDDPELLAGQARAAGLLDRYNATRHDEHDEREALLRELLGRVGDGVVVKPEKQNQAKSLIERCARLRLPNRVLVVDDSLTMRSIVRKILVQSRFQLEIFEAQEGVEAIKQIATGKFDIVFLDYNMPSLNGVETLAGIKRQSPNVHVVIMTSTADDVVAERARRAGAAAFLKKPFYPADIDTILHRIFGLQVQPPR